MKTFKLPHFLYFANSSPFCRVFLLRKNTKLIFAHFFFLVIGLWQVGLVDAQTGFTTLSTGSSETDSLYSEMLLSVEGAISISAKVRQQIRLFGHEYNATGEYDELKTAELRGKRDVRFRLVVQIQPPGGTKEVNSGNGLIIVCDSARNYLYRFTTIEGQDRLEMIDTKRVAEAIEKQGRNDISMEVGSMFGLGGLAGMLRELRNRYDFNTAPVKTQIPEKNNDMVVWKIRGRLKPEIVASLTGDGTGKKRQIPKHTPTTIDIYIGMNDHFPFDRFPYRFDYFWTADGSESAGEPFAYLLFYNLILHDANISESVFDCRPPRNILEEDVTDRVIHQMMR